MHPGLDVGAIFLDEAALLGNLVVGGLRHGDKRVIGRLALGKLRPVDELGQQARVVERGAGLREGVPEAALAGKPQRDDDNRRDEHDRANERDKCRALAGDSQHNRNQRLQRHENCELRRARADIAPQSHRLRPDRIALATVRDQEALDAHPRELGAEAVHVDRKRVVIDESV